MAESFKVVYAHERAIREAIERLAFIVPPKCAGQIVEHAYACDADYVYERETDRSIAPGRKGRVVFRVYDHPENEQEGDWAPWNGEHRFGDLVATIPDWR